MEASVSKTKLVQTQDALREVMFSWHFPQNTLDINRLDLLWLHLLSLTFDTDDGGHDKWTEMLSKLNQRYKKITQAITQFKILRSDAADHYSSTPEFRTFVSEMYREKRRRIGLQLDDELSDREKQHLRSPDLEGYKILIAGDIQFLKQWIMCLRYLRDDARSAHSVLPWTWFRHGGGGSSSSSSSSRGGGGGGGGGEPGGASKNKNRGGKNRGKNRGGKGGSSEQSAAAASAASASGPASAAGVNVHAQEWRPPGL